MGCVQAGKQTSTIFCGETKLIKISKFTQQDYML